MSLTTTQGQFIWHDCLTPDIDLALALLQPLSDWTVLEQTAPNIGRYPIVKNGNHTIAGILEMPAFLQTSGTPPYWTGYVHTDLSAAAETIPKLGGMLFTMPARSAMGTSFVFTDPGGAVLAAFEPSVRFRAPPGKQSGDIVWQRLYSADQPRAINFYSELFQWQASAQTAEKTVLLECDHQRFGDLADPASWVPVDTWVYFIAVTSLATAAATLEAHAGSILERTTIQGRSALVAKDAQGGVIGLVEQP